MPTPGATPASAPSPDPAPVTVRDLARSTLSHYLFPPVAGFGALSRRASTRAARLLLAGGHRLWPWAVAGPARSTR